MPIDFRSFLNNTKGIDPQVPYTKPSRDNHCILECPGKLGESNLFPKIPNVVHCEDFYRQVTPAVAKGHVFPSQILFSGKYKARIVFFSAIEAQVQQSSGVYLFLGCLASLETCAVISIARFLS